MRFSRDDVLRFRVRAQELDRDRRAGADAAVLDLGVQDTGPDGAAWALAIRGAQVPAEDLVLAWTLRGAPHAYRRAEVAAGRRRGRAVERGGRGQADLRRRPSR